MDNLSSHTDLLGDLNDAPEEYVYATQGQRFVNWLVDNLLMRFTLTYVTSIMLGILLGALAPEILSKLVYRDGGISWELFLLSYLIAIFNYLIYYTFCEKLFRGYTLGKLISGTRAIRQDGGELRFRDALLRSLVRLVPFEAFSGFNTLTWHDSWTDTMVVRAR